jgi:hypothetical protein
MRQHQQQQQQQQQVMMGNSEGMVIPRHLSPVQLPSHPHYRYHLRIDHHFLCCTRCRIRWPD